MKKITLLTLSIIGALSVQAQEIGTADALNFSSENITGTARFRAMSGAFGALGGDLSATTVNPAGSVIFANSLVGASLTSYNSKNNSSYFGQKSKENFNSFDINQVGGVWVFQNDNESSNWNKLAFLVNYENTNNFDNSFNAKGINPTNSIGSYFMGYANSGGYSLDNLQTIPGESISDLYTYLGETRGLGFGAQQAFLGYQAYILNPLEDDPNNTLYTNNIPAGGDFYHEYQKETRGYNGKLALNFGAQYKKRWHFGANINIHFSDYYQWTSFYEDQIHDPENGVQALKFNNELNTTGSGVSLQVGTIYKVTDELRAGVSYNSPSWMWLQDKLSQSIWTQTAENGNIFNNSVSPEVVNVYKTSRLKNPGKWTGSLAYIFGKNGLLSVDYSLKDYGSSKYSGGTGGFGVINDGIANDLDLAGELRVGTEWRFGMFSLRGGYRYEDSPYKNGKTLGDLTGFSGGFGLNFGRTKLDLAYNHWQRSYEQQFFVTGLTDAASGKIKNNNVTVSLMFDM